MAHSAEVNVGANAAIYAAGDVDISAKVGQEGGILDITALTVVNNFDGEIYYKRLYCAMDPDPLDGEPRSFLWESYNSDEVEFSVDSGESLCELNGFEPSIEGDTLKVDLEAPDGTKSTIRIALRTGGAAE